MKNKGTHLPKKEKEILKERKLYIQNQFRARLGLLIDIPKNGEITKCLIFNTSFKIFFLIGYGTTNDGNTARTFFENYKISAEITGIDENIIRRVYVILMCLNTHENINAILFKQYTHETAKLIVSKYGWWTMSPTVHKVLVHGANIIQNLILPVGNDTIFTLFY